MKGIALMRDFGDQVARAPGDLTEEKVRQECTTLFWATFQRNADTEEILEEIISYALTRLKSR